MQKRGQYFHRRKRNFHLIIILLFTKKVLRLIEYQSWLNMYLIYVSKTKLAIFFFENMKRVFQTNYFVWLSAKAVSLKSLTRNYGEKSPKVLICQVRSRVLHSLYAHSMFNKIEILFFYYLIRLDT